MLRFNCIIFAVTMILCAGTNAAEKKLPEYKTAFNMSYKTRLCIPKCCPDDHYLHGMYRRCIKKVILADFSSVPLYYDNRTRTGKFLDKTTMVSGRLLDENFKSTSFDLAFSTIVPNYYLTEEGILYSEMPNIYDRWTTYNNSQFCVDFTLPMPLFKVYEPEVRFITTNTNDDTKEANAKSSAFSYCILISVIFMATVLLVYAILPELRNLSGKVLMAYVFCLMSAFILLLAIKVSSRMCTGLTISIYFMFLASFCWMNVMSYDIWWTFRGYAKARSIHRRGENFKFGMYSMYALGLPAALTVMLVVLNELDLRHLPWLVKPNIGVMSCFIRDMEKFFYLYIPMLILISCNWLFFLMTAFNIWRLHRATAVLDSAAAGSPAAHRKQKYRFAIYLKLSIIMGINWILEVASSFNPDFAGWYITDVYNMLIGFSIFLIFVCKKKILRKLRNRLCGASSIWKPSQSLTSRRSNTSKSDVSQEIQVRINPKGDILFEKSIGESKFRELHRA